MAPHDVRSDHLYLFKWLVMCNGILIMSSGAVPCMLTQIEAQFNLNQREKGFLGGITYIMLAVACLFVRPSQKHAKPWLVGALALHCVCTFMFSATPVAWGSWAIIALKGALGLSQAVTAVYGPVWVLNKAPPEKLQLWLGLWQSSVPIGVVIGYLCATLAATVAYTDPEYTLQNGTELLMIANISAWRAPIFFGACVELCFLLGIWFTPHKHLNIIEDTAQKKSGGHKRNLSQEQLLGAMRAMNQELGGGSPRREAFAPVSFNLASPEIMSPSNPTPEKKKNSGLKKRRSAPGSVRRNTPQVQKRKKFDFEKPFGLSSSRRVSTSHNPSRSVSASPFRLSYLSSPYDKLTERGHIQSNDTQEYLNNEPSDASHADTSKIVLSHASSGTISVDLLRSQSTLVLDQEHTAFFGQMLEVVRKPVYITNCLAIAMLFFVVAGIQYWATSYFEFLFPEHKTAVKWVFVAVATTGPILGTIIGGLVANKYANPITYDGWALVFRQSLVCLCCGSVAGVFCIIGAYYVGNLFVIAFIIWLVLLFGGMVLPPATAAMLNAAGPELHIVGSSTSQIIFNILGFGLSGVFSGEISQRFEGGQGVKETVCWRIIMYGSIPAFLCFLFQNLFVRRKLAAGKLRGKPSLSVDLGHDEHSDVKAETLKMIQI